MGRRLAERLAAEDVTDGERTTSRQSAEKLVREVIDADIAAARRS